MNEDHVSAVESLLMAFITLSVPSMRTDEEVVDDVLDVLMVSVMSQTPEVRREAALRMVKLVVPDHPASAALRSILWPFL